MKKTLSFSAIMLMTAAPVFAQDTILLDEIVVSASNLPRERSKIGVRVEQLSAENTPAQGIHFTSWLNNAPGTSVTSNGGLGSSGSFRIRGLSGYYTPVYLDGIEMSDSRNPQSEFNWGSFSPMNIATAEVLKGSQSAIYGSGAVAGVLTLESKKPNKEGFSAEANAGAGSYKTQAGSMMLGYKSDTTEIAATLGKIVSEGISASSKNNSTEADGTESTQTILSIKHRLENGLLLGYNGVGIRSHVEIDGFSGDDATPENDYMDNKVEAHRVFASTQLGAVNTTLSISKFFSDGDYVYNGEISNSKSNRTKIGIVGSTNLNSTSDLSFGVSNQRENYSSQEVPSTAGNIVYAPQPVNARNSIFGAFGEYNTVIANDVSLNASLRVDNHSQAGTYPTARLAATWEIDPTVRLLASAATGFRAPSIYELNSLYSGSKDLKAEKSESFELSIEKDVTPSTTIAVTGFQSKVNNKIAWGTNENFNDIVPGDLLPTKGYELATDIFHGLYKNTAEVTTVKGGELSFKSTINELFMINGNYTFTDAKTAAGTRLLRVPKHAIKIAATYRPNERTNLTLFATRTIDRLDYDAQMSIVNAKNYTLVNFNSSYAINQTLTAFANIENLLNEKYETVTNFNQPGRSIFAGIRASF